TRRAAARDPRGHLDPSQGADPGRNEPDPLAEPLARRAAEPAVLPERLRRPDCEPRDADGELAAREHDVEHSRGLVHLRVWRHRVLAADGRRLAARAADHRVARGLRALPAAPRAAASGFIASELGAALA